MVYRGDGANEEQLGRERLRTAVAQRLHQPPEQLFDELLAEIQKFSVAKEFANDVCLVATEGSAGGRGCDGPAGIMTAIHFCLELFVLRA
jgi:hypothetical protein